MAETKQIKYLDLKYYEDQMRICIDSQWFQFAKTQVVKQYSHNYEVCDWFNTEMSFPYLSCCNDDSRIGYTISIM